MWAKFGDGFHNDDRILQLSHAGFRLYVTSVTFAHALLREGGPSGAFTATQARALARQQGVGGKVMRELVDVGLWEEFGHDGFHIYKFEKFTPSRREAIQDKGGADPVKAAAGSKGAAARWQTGSSAVAPRSQTGSPVPLPVPLPINPSSLPVEEAAKRSLERDAVLAWAKDAGYEPDYPNANRLCVSEGWTAAEIIAACKAVARHKPTRILTYIQSTQNGAKSSVLSRMRIQREESEHAERKVKRDSGDKGGTGSVADILAEVMP